MKCFDFLVQSQRTKPEMLTMQNQSVQYVYFSYGTTNSLPTRHKLHQLTCKLYANSMQRHTHSLAQPRLPLFFHIYSFSFFFFFIDCFIYTLYVQRIWKLTLALFIDFQRNRWILLKFRNLFVSKVKFNQIAACCRSNCEAEFF